MQLGSLAEISQQEVDLHAAEVKVMQATLRLRALKGDALMQSGDSYPVLELGLYMEKLAKEFGERNLRVF